MHYETNNNGSIEYWYITSQGLIHGSNYKGNPHTDNASHYKTAQILKLKKLDNVVSHLPPHIDLAEMFDIIIAETEVNGRTKGRIAKLKAKKKEFCSIVEKDYVGGLDYNS